MYGFGDAWDDVKGVGNSIVDAGASAGTGVGNFVGGLWEDTGDVYNDVTGVTTARNLCRSLTLLQFFKFFRYSIYTITIIDFTIIELGHYCYTLI